MKSHVSLVSYSTWFFVLLLQIFDDDTLFDDDEEDDDDDKEENDDDEFDFNIVPDQIASLLGQNEDGNAVPFTQVRPTDDDGFDDDFTFFVVEKEAGLVPQEHHDEDFVWGDEQEDDFLGGQD